MRSSRWKRTTASLSKVTAAVLVGLAGLACSCLGADCYDDVLISAPGQPYDGLRMSYGEDIDGQGHDGWASGVYILVGGTTGYDLVDTSGQWNVCVDYTLETDFPLGNWHYSNVDYAMGGGPCGVIWDPTAPTVLSILRETPASEITNADSVTFQVAFSEIVENVDEQDFSVSGPTGATILVLGSDAIYDVTIIGGNMVNLDAVVDLGFSGSQDIADAAGNALADTTPGTEETYTLQNTVPAIAVTPVTGLVTTEDGGSAAITFTPSTAPTFDVFIPLSCSDGTEGFIQQFVALPAGSSEPVTIHVQGIDDDIEDGDIDYTLITGDPDSQDPDYGGLDASDVADVALTNEDNDATSVVIKILPSGNGGEERILDVVVPVVEDADPIMAGELPLSAVHLVGDTITGSLQLLNESGTAAVGCYVHVYLYSVDITTRPETRVLLDHWSADFNWETMEYDLAVDTSGLAPGYYDLGMSFCDGTTQVLRIELTEVME